MGVKKSRGGGAKERIEKKVLSVAIVASGQAVPVEERRSGYCAKCHGHGNGLVDWFTYASPSSSSSESWARCFALFAVAFFEAAPFDADFLAGGGEADSPLLPASDMTSSSSDESSPPARARSSSSMLFDMSAGTVSSFSDATRFG